MKLLKIFKTVMLAALVGCTLWSCSEKKGSRYIGVVLDGEEKWSILDTETGEILCRNDFDYPPEMGDDGLFVVKDNDGMYRCYKIDDSKNPVSKDKYSQLGTFGDDGVTFAVKEGKGITIVNKKFEVVKKLPDNVTETIRFTEGLAPFCKDGKWGYLDTKGEVAIPAKFDKASQFSEGRAWAMKGDKRLLIDKKGETVKSFSSDKYDPAIGICHNGYIAMFKGEKVVFLDKNGEEKFTSNKMEISWCYMIDDNKTVFHKDGGYGIISTDGEVLVRPKYKDMGYISKDRYIAQNDDHKWGIINSKGEVILGFEYESLVQVSTDKSRYFVQEGKTWILINEKGEELTKDSYANIWPSIGTYHFYSEIQKEPEPVLEPDYTPADTAPFEDFNVCEGEEDMY